MTKSLTTMNKKPDLSDTEIAHIVDAIITVKETRTNRRGLLELTLFNSDHEQVEAIHKKAHDLSLFSTALRIEYEPVLDMASPASLVKIYSKLNQHEKANH